MTAYYNSALSIDKVVRTRGETPIAVRTIWN